VFGDKKNNILNTIAGVVNQLSTSGDDGGTTLIETLDNANQQLDSSLYNVSTIQAAVGARLGELDTLDNTGANQKINYKTSLSDLQDVDEISAISDYSLAKVALQAAEQTFSSVQQMSLFSLK
jgi:flagellar hook-associated protein 3 FlgL